MRPVLLALALCAAAGAARAQTSDLLEVTTAGDGQAAAGADLDGDGVRELWIGASLPAAGLPGTVGVHSGADGALLVTWTGEAPEDLFGTAVETIGDLDGDAIPDFAVGAPGATSDPAHRPYVQLRSGRDGQLLARAEGPAQYAGYGAAVTGLGDVDGDGVPDVAVAARGGAQLPLFDEPAFAEVRSGASGAPLWRSEPSDSIGTPVALARLDDLDGDGASELAIGLSSLDRVEVRSGASGALLMTLVAPPDAGFGYPTGFGAALDARGDLNGDGHTELLVGAPYESITAPSGGYEGSVHSGAVYVLSGAALDAPALFRVTARPGEGGFGTSVASIGDATGDGVPDFVSGNVLRRTGCCVYWAGSASVYSGLDGERLADGLHTNGRYAACGDFDGDGLADYLVTHGASWTGGAPYTTSVVAGAFPWPAADWTCAGSPTPCFAYTAWTGSPSASGAGPFAIFTYGYAFEQAGVLLLGAAKRSAPFGAGRLCVGEVFAVLPAEFRATGPAGSCTFGFTYEFPPGALGLGPLAPGQSFHAQFLMSGTGGHAQPSTSAALRVVVWP